jgi:peptidylprolyl isomerase
MRAHIFCPIQTDTTCFAIMTSNAPYLDGRHVVFGQVVEGMDVVRAIDAKVCVSPCTARAARGDQ